MALNLTLDVDFDLADRITIANLQDVYEATLRELEALEELKKKKKLEEWQEVDYERAKGHRKHIKKVLRYFMTHEAAREYFK